MLLPTPISSGTPPFWGNYRPDQFLNVFSGISTQGFWKLKVQDDTIGNEGIVRLFKITFYTSGGRRVILRKIDMQGNFLGAEEELFSINSPLQNPLKASIKDDGSMLGILFFNKNSNLYELQFFSYPSEMSSPVSIDIESQAFKDFEIAYNNSSEQYRGWGVLFVKWNRHIFYNLLNDSGNNIVVSPIEIVQGAQEPHMAFIWDGMFYQIYYTYNHLYFKTLLCSPDGTKNDTPLKFYNYGNDQLDAFYTGTETIVYWTKKTESGEAIYSFRIFDPKLFPLTDNIDIYSKKLSMSSKNLFSISANNKKIFSAYANEGNSMANIFYGRTLDIFEDILTCDQIMNQWPTARLGGPYIVYYPCTGTCLTLEDDGSTTAAYPQNELGDSIILYEWFLGATPVGTGSMLTLTQNELERVGVVNPGAYESFIQLCVTDEGNQSDCASTTLEVRDGIPPSILVITPNGGDSWAYSESLTNRKKHLIVYESYDNFPPLSRIKISYSTDEGSNWTCIADTSGSDCGANGLTVDNTNYLWTMPTQEEASLQGQTFPTAKGRIRVEVWDGSNNTSQDISDSNFYIIQPTTTSIQTLIIWDSGRIENIYEENAKNSLSLKLLELSDHKKVNGVVLDLISVPAVQSAYTNWDGDPTDQTKANTTAEKVRDYILDQINNTYSNARYIILIGDDKQIPFYRMQDRISIYPESNYPAEVGLNTSTTIGSAINQGYFLTDNFYGELIPETQENFTIYLNDFSVGRLVETPEQIEGVINQFFAADGQVNLRSSEDKVLITGFDFLYDSAYDIKERFVQVGKTTDCLLDDPEAEGGSNPCVNITYTPADLENQLFNTTPIHQLTNLNTHANHYNYATSTGNLSTETMDANTNKLSRTVLYTSGCHSGLPVPLVGENTLDLPELMSKKEVLAYIGNTGYGWGLRYGKGLTEKLMEKITEKILSRDSIKIGEALAEAKRSYYLEEKRYDVFDEKVIHQLTLYGIPNTIIINKVAGFKGEEELPPPDGEDKACVDGICMEKDLKNWNEKSALPPGITELQLNFTFGVGTYQKITTPDGEYYRLNGQASGEAGDAIQPHFKYNSYLSGTNAHGILFIGGGYTNESPFNPVITVPRSTNIDNGEGPLPSTSTFVPGVKVSFGVSSPSTMRGIGEVGYTNMLVHTGFYNSTSSTESKFSDMQFTIYYSNSLDKIAPTITDPGAGGFHTINGLQATFTATVADVSGVYRVIITYHDKRTLSWKSYDLQNTSGNNWSGKINLKGNITYYLQALDNAGNVGIVSTSGPDLSGNNQPYGSTWSGPKTWDINLLDTDEDTMPNAYEEQYSCLNKNLNDGGQDPDYDYLTNLNEFSNDTNPCNGDTDGGGDNDGSEKNNGRNNLNQTNDKHLTINMTKNGTDYTIDWNDSLGENNVIDGYYFVYRSSDPFFSPTEKITNAIPNGTTNYIDSNPSCNPCYYKVWNYQLDTQPPQVDAVVPSTGPSAGGTSVSIYGKNFQSGAKVYFDSNLASNITFVSSNLITCTTPAHPAGAVDVRVVNPNAQEGILTNGFTYQ